MAAPAASVAPFWRGALRRARRACSRRRCDRVSDRSHSTAEPRSRSDLGYGSSSDGRASTLGAPFLLLCLRGELTGSRGEVALRHRPGDDSPLRSTEPLLGPPARTPKEGTGSALRDIRMHDRPDSCGQARKRTRVTTGSPRAPRVVTATTARTVAPPRSSVRPASLSGTVTPPALTPAASENDSRP